MKRRMSEMKQHTFDGENQEQLKREIVARFQIEKAKVYEEKKRKVLRRGVESVILVVFSFLIMLQNTTFRGFASEIPILGDLVSIITGETLLFSKEEAEITIDVPKITEENQVYSKLNEKYLREGQRAYQSYIDVINKVDEKQMYVSGTYDVKVNDNRFLVIDRTFEETVGSTNVEHRFDTFDKKNEVLLSLKMLFKTENYLEVLAQEIEHQMKERMRVNSDIKYWVLDYNDTNWLENDPNFYINENHELVISFDKYEVSAGYMGTQEFIISTTVLKPILVDENFFN